MKIKRIIILFAAIFLIQASSIHMAYSKTNDTSRIDAVLVLDESGSMSQSDPKGISAEAANMFIDMCSVEGDRVGVVAYTDKIVEQVQLKEMNSADDKKQLKNIISKIPKKSATDIGLGLKAAVGMLDSSKDKSHKPLIILLSDGKNELGANSRNKDQSETDKKEALQIASSKGYPIYTIGLNADGSVDQNELKQIASDTNAKTFITDTANNLPQILSEIFADNLNLKIVSAGDINGNGDFQDVKIEIPDSNVVEANISLLSQKPVEVKIFDSKNKEHSIPSDDIYYSVSNSYSMIKIIKPQKGDWLLKVKGITGDKIKVNLIFNYDLKLIMETPKKDSYHKGDNVGITAYLSSNGQKVQDKDLYKEMKANIIVKDLDTQKEQKTPMTPTGDGFSGNISIEDNHKYEIKTIVDAESFSRESESMVINAASTLAPVKPKSALPYIITAIGLILLAGVAYTILALINKANKSFFGQVMVEVRELDTNKLLPPQYRRLDTYRGKVTLYQLLQLLPEYKEAEKIVLLPAKNDRLMLKNMTASVVERTGRAVDASKGYELKPGDRVTITLSTVQRSISLEYFI